MIVHNSIWFRINCVEKKNTENYRSALPEMCQNAFTTNILKYTILQICQNMNLKYCEMIYIIPSFVYAFRLYVCTVFLERIWAK